MGGFDVMDDRVRSCELAESPAGAAVCREYGDVAAGVALGAAAECFLARAELDGGTIRSYAQTMHRLCRELGGATPLSEVTAGDVAAAFTTAWDGVAARTWNRHRAALRSFTAWAAGRGWHVADLSARIERRPVPRNRPRVIDRHTVAAVLRFCDVPLREQVLWRVLYESAAGAASVLSLDVENLDLGGDRGHTTRDGSRCWVCWQPDTTPLLARLIGDRRHGPLFLTDRRPSPARMPGSADLCAVTGRGRLSYERAEYLFKQTTKRVDPLGRGYTLHQLRHARLAHLSEDGWTLPRPAADGA